MRSEPKYFISIALPQKLVDEISEIKQDLKNDFGLKRSARQLPHLTLAMPFRINKKKLDQLKLRLCTFFLSQEEFEIEVNGFSMFPSATYYLKVVENNNLRQLQSALVSLLKKEFGVLNTNHRSGVFHPHITLASGDVRRKHMVLLDEYFRSYEIIETFACQQVQIIEIQSGIHRKVETFLMKKGGYKNNHLF